VEVVASLSASSTISIREVVVTETTERKYQMKTQKSRKLAAITSTLLMVGLAMSTPAHAETIFDRLRSLITDFSTVKTFLIWIGFLVGLGGILWAGMEMIKKSKNRGGEDVTWMSIGIKFLAGALLLSLTVTSDTMRQTALGTSATTTSTSNMQ
jgi:hypothetical protein